MGARKWALPRRFVKKYLWFLKTPPKSGMAWQNQSTEMGILKEFCNITRFSVFRNPLWNLGWRIKWVRGNGQLPRRFDKVIMWVLIPPLKSGMAWQNQGRKRAFWRCFRITVFEGPSQPSQRWPSFFWDLTFSRWPFFRDDHFLEMAFSKGFAQGHFPKVSQRAFPKGF